MRWEGWLGPLFMVFFVSPWGTICCFPGSSPVRATLAGTNFKLRGKPGRGSQSITLALRRDGGPVSGHRVKLFSSVERLELLRADRQHGNVRPLGGPSHVTRAVAVAQAKNAVPWYLSGGKGNALLFSDSQKMRAPTGSALLRELRLTLRNNLSAQSVWGGVPPLNGNARRPDRSPVVANDEP